MPPPPQKKTKNKNKTKTKTKLYYGMTFPARIHRTDPQNNGGRLGTLSGCLKNTFSKRTSQKGPEIYLGPKNFRSIFEKQTPAYSLGVPLLGLAKSIYYFVFKTIIGLVFLNIQGIVVLSSLLGIMKTLKVFCFPWFYSMHWTSTSLKVKCLEINPRATPHPIKFPRFFSRRIII